MNSQATRLDAARLMFNGALALADAEANGIAIDVQYCNDQIKLLETRIKDLKARLRETEVVKLWKKTYGSKFNIDSNDQLADILFNKMEYKPKEFTEKGNPAVGEDALDALEIPMVKGIIKLRKMLKVKNTYLTNIIREIDDQGLLHPIFKLHTVVTYRSSCSNPNFQNMPIRDKVMGRIIRRAIRARPGRKILELDFKGLEVNIGACYHKDPNMIKYILDKTTDMHRDMAMELYLLKLIQITKDIRFCAKNGFVFPEFYGDYFVRCAQILWSYIKQMNLTTADGIPLKEHLKSKNIATLSSFTAHVEEVENDFWGRRFQVYDQWKQDHYNDYLKVGYFDMLTGFRCSGIMGYNEVSNYPVQGAAFHCLLWCFIELNKWLKENRMNTMLVGQIHDSAVLDLDPAEEAYVLEKAVELMSHKIREEWKWIIVPLEIEAEASEVDGNWFEKKTIKLVA